MQRNAEHARQHYDGLLREGAADLVEPHRAIAQLLRRTYLGRSAVHAQHGE